MKLCNNTQLFNRNALLLLLIVTTCFVLRIANITDQSIWLDEAYSIQTSESGFKNILEKTTSEDFHPPLYYFVLYLWIECFGDSEFSCRFLSLMFSVAAVPVIYLIAARLFNKQTGLLSALLISISTFHIEYGQEVRGYSMLLFFSLISMYYFIGMIGKKAMVEMVAYTAMTLLLLYTHYFGALVVVCQDLYVLILLLFSKTHIHHFFKRWFVSQVLLGLGYLPWVVVLIKKLNQVGITLSWMKTPTIHDLFGTFKAYSSNSLVLLFVFFLLAVFASLKIQKKSGGTEAEGNLVSIKDFGFIANSTEMNSVLLLWLWLGTTVILPFFLSLFWTPIYINRVTIAASAAFYLLAARGFWKIPSNSLKIIILLVVIINAMTGIWHYHKKTGGFLPKEQWRNAAEYIDTSAHRGDLILFNSRYGEMPFNYYSTIDHFIKKPFPKNSKHIDRDNIKALKPLVSDHKRIWLLYSHRGKNWELINKTLTASEHYQKDYKKYIGIELFLFVKNR